jgi:glycosyltransferase involved in cell wall biosynthesis
VTAPHGSSPSSAEITLDDPGAGEAPPLSCTVVICTRDRPEELDRCLAALARVEGPAFQVLVVDNAPQDESTRRVATRRGVDYLPVPEPGVSRARHRGALACTTDIVAFLDDDAEAEPGWLSALLREFRDPQVSACGGRIAWFDPEGEDGADPSHEPTEQRRVVDPSVAGWYEKVNFGGLGSGANMAFRRSALGDAAVFHPRLGLGTPIPGGADTYAFFAVVRAGHRAVYTPDAVVRHPLPVRGAPRELRRRRDLTAAVAYWAYFLVEERGFRRATAAYLLRSLLGRPRGWSSEPVPRRERGLSASGIAAAVLNGLRCYGRSLGERAGPSRARPQS